MTFREFLNESELNESNEHLTAEEKKILAAFKKHIKEKRRYSQETVIEGIPVIQDGRPGLAIFYWLGGTTNDAGFDSSYTTDILENGTKLSNVKFSKGTTKRRTGVKPGDQIKELIVRVRVVYLKNSANFETLIELLKKAGIEAELRDDRLVGGFETVGEKKEIESIVAKFKNVNVEFGKIYYDVDNKHGEAIFTITIK